MKITFSALAEGEGGVAYAIRRLEGITVAVLPKEWDGETRPVEGKLVNGGPTDLGEIRVQVGETTHIFPIEEVEEVRYL